MADLVQQAMRRFDAVQRRSECLCGTLLINYGRVELELIVKHGKQRFKDRGGHAHSIWLCNKKIETASSSEH